MYSKTSQLFLFMICTIAKWQLGMTLIRREWWEHSHVPKPNARTKPQIFLFYVLLAMPEGVILHPNAKQ